MARVECDIEETLVEHQGKSVDGLCATCSRCEATFEVPGYDTPDNRRKLVHKMQNECADKKMHRHHYVFPEVEREDVDLHTTEE